MATYVPDNNAPDVAIHMVDQWKNTAPKKQKSNGVDEGSFQVVRSRKKASKTSRGGDDEEDEGRGIDKADSEEEDEEFLLSDPDALVEIASRVIEESDDDEAFNFPRKNKTNEEIVRDLVMRKVTFKITERFKDQLATRNLNSLSTADRKKLIKSWGNLLLLDAKADMNRQIEDYSSAAEIVMRYDAVTDAAILKSASAIGMTTNGAAKYKR